MLARRRWRGGYNAGGGPNHMGENDDGDGDDDDDDADNGNDDDDADEPHLDDFSVTF